MRPIGSVLESKRGSEIDSEATTKINGKWGSAGGGRGGVVSTPVWGAKIGPICPKLLHEEALLHQQIDIRPDFRKKKIRNTKSKIIKINRVFPFQIESGGAQMEAIRALWGTLWAHSGSQSVLLVAKWPSGASLENYQFS